MNGMFGLRLWVFGLHHYGESYAVEIVQSLRFCSQDQVIKPSLGLSMHLPAHGFCSNWNNEPMNMISSTVRLSHIQECPMCINVDGKQAVFVVLYILQQQLSSAVNKAGWLTVAVAASSQPPKIEQPFRITAKQYFSSNSKIQLHNTQDARHTRG
jgi:hypothetical protein